MPSSLRLAITNCVTIALLTSCGGVTAGGPAAVPRGAGVPGNVQRDSSWMLAEAHHRTLIYVSTSQRFLYAFTMDGTAVGQVNTGIEAASYMCSDLQGNVYIPTFDASSDYGEIAVFSHAGKRRKRTLYLQSYYAYPLSCAVDPLTGSVAVPVSYGYREAVAIFPGGKGEPLFYSVTNIDPNFCAYDSGGNLFCSGGGTYQLTELPFQGNSFEDIAVNQFIGITETVQWEGKLLTVEDKFYNRVYQIEVSGSSATVVKTIGLQANSTILPSAIRGSTFVAPDGRYALGFWKYPKGGQPVREISGLDFLEGAIVSVPPTRH